MAAPPDRNTLIAKMKAVIKRVGGRWVTLPQFCRLAKVTAYQVNRCFANYGELMQAAGLPPRGPNGRIPDHELMRAMAELFRQEKGVVTYGRFSRLGRYSAAVYAKHWGSWREALRAFADWQSQHDPEFPYAGQLPRRNEPAHKHVWPVLDGRRYGEMLNFRGLLHAPVNEQGVIFLFATLACDLGFIVESLASEFPDCEAKRRAGQTWQRVRIEFEFASRNFRNHRHDPKGCDLIVCWEHNWTDCPIEVLALKPVVAGIAGGIEGRSKEPQTS